MKVPRVQAVLIGFSIILLPVIAIFVLRMGKNQYKGLPFIGNKYVNEKGDSVFHTVPSFSFIDQNGNIINNDSMHGKVYLAEFFFTRCGSVCPIMLENIRAVYSKVLDDFENEDNFGVLSFSLDSKHDSVPILAKYARKNHINFRNWHLLTGNRDSIQKIIGPSGYLVLQTKEVDDPANFMHSEIVCLIDREGHIRGQYNATDYQQVEELKDAVKYLMVRDGRN